MLPRTQRKSWRRFEAGRKTNIGNSGRVRLSKSSLKHASYFSNVCLVSRICGWFSGDFVDFVLQFWGFALFYVESQFQCQIHRASFPWGFRRRNVGADVLFLWKKVLPAPFCRARAEPKIDDFYPQILRKSQKYRGLPLQAS